MQANQAVAVPGNVATAEEDVEVGHMLACARRLCQRRSASPLPNSLQQQCAGQGS